jgi:hypothetical protein
MTRRDTLSGVMIAGCGFFTAHLNHGYYATMEPPFNAGTINAMQKQMHMLEGLTPATTSITFSAEAPIKVNRRTHDNVRITTAMRHHSDGISIYTGVLVQHTSAMPHNDATAIFELTQPSILRWHNDHAMKLVQQRKVDIATDANRKLRAIEAAAKLVRVELETLFPFQMGPSVSLIDGSVYAA